MLLTEKVSRVSVVEYTLSNTAGYYVVSNCGIIKILQAIIIHDKVKSLLASKSRMKKVKENIFVQTEQNIEVQVSLIPQCNYTYRNMYSC